MKDLKDRLKNHLADKGREWEWWGGDNEEKLKILVEKNSNERDEEKMDE